MFSKGSRGKRATAFARHVQPWQHLETDKWMTAAPPALCQRYDRRTPTVMRRWHSAKTRRCTHALVSGAWLDGALLHGSHVDEQRARRENAINAEKAGLRRPRRRQKHWQAPQAWVLLPDLAPNIVAWPRRFWAPEPARGEVGIYVIVHELLPLPGNLRVAARGLVKWRVQVTHPLAKPVVSGLSRLLGAF